MQSKKERIEMLKEWISEADKKIDALNAKYRGVRPSWVSSDICSLGMDANRWEQEIKMLEGDQ